MTCVRQRIGYAWTASEPAGRDCLADRAPSLHQLGPALEANTGRTGGDRLDARPLFVLHLEQLELLGAVRGCAQQLKPGRPSRTSTATAAAG